MKKTSGQRHTVNSPNLPRERLLYGRKPLLELLRHRPGTVDAVFIVSGAKLSAEFSTALESWSLLEKKEAQSISTEQLSELAKGNHQGVLAVVAEAKQYSLEEIIEQSLSETGRGLLIVLDSITDPQNLGAVLRVAEASGVDGVIITEVRSSPITSVARKASSGASEFVPVCQVGNLQRTFEKLKERGYWIAGTVGFGSNVQSIFEAKIPKPLAIVFGAEGEGMRRLTVRECDLLLSIPMQGAVESLNVAQAAAVCLFEILRRKLTEESVKSGK